MILRFFNKEYKRKKTGSASAKAKGKTPAGKKPTRPANTTPVPSSRQPASGATASLSAASAVIPQEDTSEISPDEIVIASALESEHVVRDSDVQRERDAGQGVIDDEVVSRVKKVAVEQMRARGVQYTDAEHAHALKILPRVRTPIGCYRSDYP